MRDQEIIAEINRGYVCPPDAGPEWRAAFKAGIDMSLLEHALELTPAERLAEHQRVVDFLLGIQEAGPTNGSE